ncbi:MAG: malto-oligosyltrehalose synthase [Candidatus Xenobia bacterium]
MLQDVARGSRGERAAGRLYEALLAKPPQTRRPAATYRLQLSARFDFDRAAGLVPYLARLGITHVYASPVFRAEPGSSHGYDVMDHNELNPELGGVEAWQRLLAALRHHDMGLVADFVSNHMGVGAANPYWCDVLENGAASPYARMFDIDWAQGEGKLLIPVLGDQYGHVLERGELRLAWSDGAFWLYYWDDRLPLSVPSYHSILNGLPPPDSIQALLRDLPSVLMTGEAEHLRRQVLKRRLRDLVAQDADVARHVEAALVAFNGTPGQPDSFDRLDLLLTSQPWRLADWRVAGEEINYRRFFDINRLAALRMEDPEVFTLVHRLVFKWLADGEVDGLRIDHPDGLYDPTEYFERLQEEYLVRVARTRYEGDVPWDEVEPALRHRLRAGQEEGLRRPLYVVVEKILAHGERVPGPWTIDGTTGYEFLNALNGLFVDRRNGDALTEIYERFTHRRRGFADMVYRKKKLVMADVMASEMNLLARRLYRIAQTWRHTRDFTLNSLRRVLVEYIACLAIYRTYIDNHGEVAERDCRYVEEAVGRAMEHTTSLDPSIFKFLQDTILFGKGEARIFVMKLQQLSGAIMAKAMEDTSFYLYNRLISLNEVGGEPARFGNSVWDFHHRNRDRVENWAGALSATSTHDTKRSEDVRARINVLSEVPEEWKYHLYLWNRIHLRHKLDVGGRLAPDRNEELFLYQTLIGTWPRSWTIGESYRERIKDTVRKALREAKQHTSWINPNTKYEDAVLAFTDHVLDGPETFLADFIPFVRRIMLAALHNGISQVLLKMASPGVPDIYQGCELWDDSMVDPDNRRPVDFGLRERLLDEVERMGPGALYGSLGDPLDEGRLKLFVTRQGLQFRKAHANLFMRGTYVPLETVGGMHRHICAFARMQGGRMAIAVAPRLVYRLLGDDGQLPPFIWHDSAISVPAPGTFREVFTGRVIKSRAVEERPVLLLREVLADLPVALLWRE